MGFWDLGAGDIFSGAMSLGGSLIGASSAKSGVDAMNAANAAEAQKNRDFQERMSSTAHQREVEDLRKAGLNPILSATGGSGASSPGGSVIPMENNKLQMSNIIANTAKMVADTNLSRAMAKTEVKKQENIDADTKYQKKGQISVGTPWGNFSLPVGTLSAGLVGARDVVSNGMKSLTSSKAVADRKFNLKGILTSGAAGAFK